MQQGKGTRLQSNFLVVILRDALDAQYLRSEMDLL
jgi:hypothetical protein